MSELEEYRAEIDAIDNELIALFKKRIGVVAKVGEYKRRNGEVGAFIRAGREGRMHRRIYDTFKDSAFNPQAAVAIWRIIISASTHHESPLRLGVMQQDAPHAAALAQAYFGDFLESRSYVNAGTLLSDVYEGKASIAIVPSPRDETAMWWHLLAQHQEPRLHIFAKLPVVLTHAHQPTAYAVAQVTPEPSDADESYFAARLDASTSTSKLLGALSQAGVQASIINMLSQPPMRWVLVRMDGFYNLQSDAIQAVSEHMPDCRLRYLGAHPKAIEA